MKLGEILNGNLSTSAVNQLFESAPKTASNSDFSKTLTKAIDEVNSVQETGYKAMNDIATGEVKNLQEAVVQIEKAELNLKLALEIKNKTLSAYKEVMRMQI